MSRPQSRCVLHELNARHAVVRVGSKVQIVWTDDDSLMSRNAFFDWYANAKIHYTSWLV